MSEENVETFRRGFAAVNHRDLDGFLANVAPDVEFMSLIAEAEGETFHGHEGVRRWWNEVVLPARWPARRPRRGCSRPR